MITAVEQVVRYCKRYEVLCAGANERGYCNTTACWNSHRLEQSIDAVPTIAQMPPAEPKKGRDCTDFVRWLMDEVMDEENWQMNAVANGEIICRKLKKLGMLDVVDGYYVETQKTGEWILTPMQKGEPMDDYISRQAATSIPILPKEHRKVFSGEDDAFETGWNEALACVNKLPSVCLDLSDYCDRLWKLAYERGKAQQKTGEWIRHDEVKNVYGGTCVECSECGEKYVVQHIEDEKYCRNCGADMRGEDDEKNRR